MDAKTDEEILLELETAEGRLEARKVRKKYAKSSITGKMSLRLLASLERLALYFQILIFAAYLFVGFASFSGEVVYAVYETSVFSGIFLLVFGIAGMGYAVFKSVKSKCNPLAFIIGSLFRIALAFALIAVETLLKLVSNGGLFNV